MNYRFGISKEHYMTIQLTYLSFMRKKVTSGQGQLVNSGDSIWGNISSEKLEDLKELGADSIFEM